LGQNWDWVAALEELAVLVTWEMPDGREVLTFTEPGMLGKIGLNDRGLGVCLNFMVSHQPGLDGVPVHILTRTLLDCADVAEAKQMLAHSGFGKSSNFLLADASGDACAVEFAAGERYEVKPCEGLLVHTNHCVAKGAEPLTEHIPTTLERLEKAFELLANRPDRDVDTMREVLLDSQKGPASINMSYHPEPLLGNQEVGTCATILMDLAAREMHIARGPGARIFTRVRVGAKVA
jgi:isopenicillin-N N-acyltransferase-like protein